MFAVAPGEVDAEVVAYNGPHLVGVPSTAERRGSLLVFFPGTGARADDYSRFLTHATEQGLHVIGLSYDNRVSLNFEVCRDRPEAERCHRDARLEILRGEASAYTPPEVDPTQAAYPRLRGLLGWLSVERPDEGWEAWLDPSDPDGVRFSDVITAGHSQGGGHAAFTARLHEVSRAILFDATEAAEWTAEPLATPGDRLFGVVHRDEFAASAMRRSWDQLGVPAPEQPIGDPIPAELDGHRFGITREDCAGDGNARLHNCAVADAFLPPDGPDGPRLESLWNALLFD